MFGRKNQSHLVCETAISTEEYFETARPWERSVFDAVDSGLRARGLDPMIDPVGIGILLKNGPMFAELRAKTKSTAVGFNLGRKLEHGRSRTDIGDSHGDGMVPDDVDDLF